MRGSRRWSFQNRQQSLSTRQYRTDSPQLRKTLHHTNITPITPPVRCCPDFSSLCSRPSSSDCIRPPRHLTSLYLSTPPRTPPICDPLSERSAKTPLEVPDSTLLLPPPRTRRSRRLLRARKRLWRRHRLPSQRSLARSDKRSETLLVVSWISVPFPESIDVEVKTLRQLQQRTEHYML